jgi:hypothetical protein
MRQILSMLLIIHLQGVSYLGFSAFHLALFSSGLSVKLFI